jgi:hypothetical protein
MTLYGGFATGVITMATSWPRSTAGRRTVPDPSDPAAVEAGPADLLAMIRHAVANPESVVGRRIHTGFGDPVTETLERWSARAVEVVAVARAAADAEIAALRAELADARNRPRGHRLLTWDDAEQPDLDGLAEILLDLSGGAIRLHRVDTGDDRHAIVLATEDLDANQLREIIERGRGVATPRPAADRS